MFKAMLFRTFCYSERAGENVMKYNRAALILPLVMIATALSLFTENITTGSLTFILILFKALIFISVASLIGLLCTTEATVRRIAEYINSFLQSLWPFNKKR